MDDQRFDAALRALHAGTTRRKGLAGMLAVLVGGAGAARAAAGGPEAAGPCGDGSAKDNRCKANSDCCTKYCAQEQCRCKPNWMECKKDEHCCSGACVDGRCDGGCKEAGGRCEEQFNCCDGLDCIKGACAKAKTATCSKKNCPGCCSGTMCRVGAASRACGAKGAACETCVSPKTCQGGSCKSGGGCSAATCPNGCCKDGVCKGGTSDSACGKGGAACAACTGGKTCQNGTCKSGGGCTTDSDCPGATPICDGGTCRAETWGNQTTFGSAGNNDGQFGVPVRVFVSADGLTAWVADYQNAYVSIWTRPDATSAAWTYLTKFGSYGSGDSQFIYPNGISVSADTLTAWVTDMGNNRISIWTRPDNASTTWTFSTKFGSVGAGASQFIAPGGNSVTADGLTILIADDQNFRISVWTRPNAASTTWTNQTTFGTGGINENQFQNPKDVFVSADGLTAWIANYNQRRIAIWTRPDAASTTWSFQTSFGSDGSGPSQFSMPTSVVASADGLKTWIADTNNNRISIWTRPDATSTAWTNQTTFGSLGATASEFNSPKGVFASADGATTWIADSGNARISVWKAS